MGFADLITSFGKRLLGTSNDATLRRYQSLLGAVNAMEEQLRGEDDDQLRARSQALLRRVRDEGARLGDVQAEAFALVREVADRRLGAWNAVEKEAAGFADAEWGDQLASVEAARKRRQQGEAIWDIDLPASVYEQVRSKVPTSQPPYRMRAHDVQIVGAGVLHDGMIAELKTGEGKTLVAVFACYLNALSGKGVTVVTVNDYLARRDAEWNAPIFRFLGIQVGAIQSEMDPPARKAVYAMDVVYGTNNEFGFDYLRDNLKQRLEDQVQTRRDYAIVDEVDSVLIDEARTPLIISGPAQGRDEFYQQADQVARSLEKDVHYEVDIKDRTITLTEEGIERATELFGVSSLYDAEGMHLPHFLDNALKAHELFHRDKEYMVVNGEVKIVDEHTGRVLAGRRWSEGLHQAVETKEGVQVQPESQTYATITLQNYFRLYGKLAGMTGTALTEANEFASIYKLQPVAVPTNRPIIRRDLHDLIYGSEQEKFDAIAKEVDDLHAIGQPILVGTRAVETSDRLSEAFKRRGIKHKVLNARPDVAQREAETVAQAGEVGAVTVATNMAGRGTDIVLGKASFKQLLKHWQQHGVAPRRIRPDEANLDEAVLDVWAKRWLGDEEAGKLRGEDPENMLGAINRHRHQMGWPELPMPSSLRDGADCRQLGGLRIIGTERHESRRVDNQLRGRSGRQGDPGSTRFFLSLDDELMKRFAGPTMANMMRSMGLRDGVPIESRMVSRAVEKAQRRVEEFNFGIRKNVLEYDEVMNLQRRQIYQQRQGILEGERLQDTFLQLYGEALDDLVQSAAEDGTRGEELGKRLAAEYEELTGLPAPGVNEVPVLQGGDACRDFFLTRVKTGLEGRRSEFGDEVLQQVLRFVLLESIDHRWKDHIDFMDQLRRGIGLESYGQKDPKMRFKQEGFRRYEQMHELIRLDVARLFFRLQLVPPQEEQKPGIGGMFEMGGFQPRGTGDRSEDSSGSSSGRGPSKGSGKGPRPPGRSAPPPPQAPLDVQGAVPDPGKPGPDDPCPCGSGQSFKRCHGKY